MLLAGLLVLVTFAARAQAQEPVPGADKLVGLRLELLTQQARQEVAAWETDLISPPGTTKTVGNFQDPSAVLKEIRKALNDEYGGVRNSLSVLAAKAKARRDETQKEWAEVYRQRAAYRLYIEKQEKTYGFDFETGAQSGFEPNLFDAVLVAWAAFVFVVALRLRQKEQRLEARKSARAAALAAVLIGLFVLPGCGGRPNPGDAGAWATREEEELKKSLNRETAKADEATSAANDKWQAAVNEWAKLVAAPSDKVDELVKGGEGEIRERLRAIATEAKLTAGLARDAEEQHTRLHEEKEKLDRLVSGAKWRSLAAVAGRAAIALVLFGVSILPFWQSRRVYNRARRLAARTCPRCTSVGTLRVERVGGDSGYRAGKGKKAKTKAKAEDEEEEDESGEVQCTKCGLRFRKSYLKVPRLCFPTVGVRSSGKTHMLATAYNRVVSRTSPCVARIMPAASAGDGAAEKRFEQFINLIMNMKGEAGATDRALPDPILVQVKDADPKGANSALVNLFDYSGELVNPDVDVNQLKKTAVKMDGFMLFLDPTQLYGDGANVSLNQQLGMLDGFLADMRRERKVGIGDVIPVPVAVCIPKFDLLLTENPIGGQSVPFIRHMLEDLTPAIPKETTLDMIRARSDLVEQMLPLMFPGVDIREIVEGYFGKQVMFFPLTSVNLIESELGKKDLNARSAIIPYGVAEPIIWLLHMHGYEVFAG